MPKNKKPAPFMTFVMAYKQKFPNMTLECAISEADCEWRNMSNEQKAKYKSLSKTDPILSTKPREKYSSQGVPLSQLEKEKQDSITEERLIKEEIQDLVIAGRNSKTLSSQRFYLIMANYFVRNGDDYIPAEISLCEYSLKDGITNTYHSLINPNLNGFFGHAYEAVEHANNTHNLPLPPNALGEQNKAKLYSSILKFIQSKNTDIKEVPPVYTIDSSLPVLKSILNNLKNDCEEMPDIRVYSLHYLFYVLKKTTSEIGETKQVDSIHITNAILDRDYYEYQSGIACEFHEKIDKSNFCTLSYVIRWAYTLSDNMCMDLSIPLQPGVHISLDADLTSTNISEFNDNESLFSISTCNTNFTQPKLWESFDTDRNSSISLTGEHFPKNYKNVKQNRNMLQQYEEDFDFDKTLNDFENIDIKDDDNPWSLRYKNKPREPNEDSFNFDASCNTRGRGLNVLSKYDSSDSESCVSTSRGRGFLLKESLESSLPKKMIGRGRLLN